MTSTTPPAATVPIQVRRRFSLDSSALPMAATSPGGAVHPLVAASLAYNKSSSEPNLIDVGRRPSLPFLLRPPPIPRSVPDGSTEPTSPSPPIAGGPRIAATSPTADPAAIAKLKLFYSVQNTTGQPTEASSDFVRFAAKVQPSNVGLAAQRTRVANEAANTAAQEQRQQQNSSPTNSHQVLRKASSEIDDDRMKKKLLAGHFMDF